MSGPGFVTRRTTRDTHGARNKRGQWPKPPRLPRRHTRRWYVAVGVLAAVEYTLEFGFGVLLGLADIAVADSVPFGAARSVVFVIALGMSIGAVVLTNRAVSTARGRRPKRHRRHLSTDSQAYNLSNRGLSRRFRRG